MDMQPGLQIDFNAITRLFSDAQQEDHDFLFEYETYHLLADSGAIKQYREKHDFLSSAIRRKEIH